MRTSPKPPVPAFIFLLVIGLALISTCIALYNLEAAGQRTSFLVVSVVGLGLAIVSGWLFYAHRHTQARLHEITALQTGILQNANVAVISTNSAGVIRWTRSAASRRRLNNRRSQDACPNPSKFA